MEHFSNNLLKEQCSPSKETYFSKHSFSKALQAGFTNPSTFLDTFRSNGRLSVQICTFKIDCGYGQAANVNIYVKLTSARLVDKYDLAGVLKSSAHKMILTVPGALHVFILSYFPG